MCLGPLNGSSLDLGVYGRPNRHRFNGHGFGGVAAEQSQHQQSADDRAAKRANEKGEKDKKHVAHPPNRRVIRRSLIVATRSTWRATNAVLATD